VNEKSAKEWLKKFVSVGLKDMHPMQRNALMELVSTAVNLAAQVEDQEILRDVEEQVDELVKLFGGLGVRVEQDTTFH
jgi:hypothetical protein